MIHIPCPIQQSGIFIQQLGRAKSRRFRVALASRQQVRQPVRLREGVWIEHDKPFPAGEARGLVVGDGEACVRSILHKRRSARDGSLVWSRVVGRGVINQDRFKVLTGLGVQTLKQPWQMIFAFKRNNQDGDARQSRCYATAFTAAIAAWAVMPKWA
jgi:hypothetical protein